MGQSSSSGVTESGVAESGVTESGITDSGINIERNDLRAGDHICRRCSDGSFEHHGIYVGEDKVIHLTKLNGWHGPVYSSLDSFLDGSPEIRRYEYEIDAASDNAEVVRRAYSAVQFGFRNKKLHRYDSRTFAFYCKTGRYYTNISHDSPPRSNNSRWAGPMPGHSRHVPMRHEFTRHRPYGYDDPFRHTRNHHHDDILRRAREARDRLDIHTRNRAPDFHTHRPMGPR
ncbi:hypothetical protein ABFS83_10G078900 [Erythranthe nasuta]